MSKIKLKLIDEYASQLSAYKLPTCRDVIKAIYFGKSQSNKTNLENQVAINCVAQQVIELWKQSEIPSANTKTVKDKVKNCFDKYKQLCKTDFNHIKNKEQRKKLDAYKVKLVYLIYFLLLLS